MTPVAVFAQDGGIDGRCFTDKQCERAKGDFESNDYCPGKMGFCFAKPIDVDLNVPIGSVGTISGLAHYAQVGYQYAVGVGIIIAVLMGSIAGVRWMTAAGVAARVSSAKTLLTNAVLGLVLLLGSYFILFTINPDILDFKVLRVAMNRREIFNSNSTCQTFGEDMKFFLKGSKKYDDLNPKDFKEAGKVSSFGGPECGKEYFIEDGGGVTCKGYTCQAVHSCYQNKCVKAAIAGVITGDVETPMVDNDLLIRELCQDGSIETIKQVDISELEITEGSHQTEKIDFIFKTVESGDISNGECGDKKSRGFFIQAEVNETTVQAGKSVLLGAIDDDHGFGRNIAKASEKPAKCVLDVNLCTVTPHAGSDTCSTASQTFEDADDAPRASFYDGKKLNCDKSDCGGNFTDEQYANESLNPNKCATSLCMYLIPPQWFFSGKSCDIQIYRSRAKPHKFPGI